jgi:hypothetical protein
MPIKVKSGETESQFVERCVPIEIGAGKGAEQATAICYSIYQNRNMKKTTQQIVNQKFKNIADKREMELEGACWDNYIQIGTKIVDGREVPDCRGPID